MGALFRCDRDLRLRFRSGLANQQRETREGKTAGDVVDHVYLTEIQAGLQGLQWDINLEDDGLAVRRGDFAGDDGFGFVEFCWALHKFAPVTYADGLTR